MAARRWAIAQKKHLAILRLLRSGVGVRRTASTVGVGVRTVQRRVDFLRQQTLDPGDIDFKRVSGKSCEVHGPVVVWPCVACAAASRGTHPG